MSQNQGTTHKNSEFITAIKTDHSIKGRLPDIVVNIFRLISNKSTDRIDYLRRNYIDAHLRGYAITNTPTSHLSNSNSCAASLRPCAFFVSHLFYQLSAMSYGLALKVPSRAFIRYALPHAIPRNPIAISPQEFYQQYR